MAKFGQRGFDHHEIGRAGCAVVAAVLAAALLAAPVTSTARPQASQPTFSKSFTPDTIGPGSVSTLVFTIDNSASSTPVTDLAFTDSLPAGVTIATPAGAASTCTAGGTLSAPAGGNTITFADGAIAAFGSCTLSVNVTSSTIGVHSNVSGDLTSSAGNSGAASDDLTVDSVRPGFAKGFSPVNVPLGGRSTLTFTVDNSANPQPAFSLSFVDDLPSGLEVASPANASTTCTAGTLTAVAGSDSIGYALGSVAAGSTCTVEVDVIGVAGGLQVNTSGDLTSSFGGPPVSSGLATAALLVTADPLTLTKSFTDDPAFPGGTVTLQFTVRNLDRSDAASGLSFTDDLDATLSGLSAIGLPQNDVCGPGSSVAGTGLLTFTGGSLPPEGSCTFNVTLAVPAGAAPGNFVNTTSQISGDVGGAATTGSPASDTLFVQPVPVLTKTFLDAGTMQPDPVVAAGSDVVARFEITNTSPTSSATGIVFIDELTTFLPAPVSASLPPTPCGAGSSISLVNLGSPSQQGLSLTNGSLGPGASCTFDVTLTVPTGVSGGTYTNTTEPITATVGGESVTGNPATDTFDVVAAPRLVKDFTDDPVAPGDTVTLEFTLTHGEAAPTPATGIAFTDDLDATVTGLTTVGLPASDVCGPGSTLSGISVLSLTGASLAADESCTFSVTVQVPAGAVPGTYPNVTSDVVATVDGIATTNVGAQDDLQISGLSFSKEFTDDPVVPGEMVTLEFTIANTTASSAASGLVFQDDLNDVIPGLVSVDAPQSDVCGVGSQLSGTSVLNFTGGALAAGASCTFSVTLQVPAATPSDTYGNATTNLAGTVGGSSVTVPPAADGLVVSGDVLVLDKAFVDDPVGPGDTVTLEFTLTNQEDSSATGITFSDDLDATLAGLSGVGLPLADVCGAGSQLSGTSFLSLTGGSLAAGASCSFDVTLQVPAVATAGSYPNTTSQVSGTSGGLAVTGSPASDDLQISTVDFSKSFDGPTSASGDVVLTFTLDNPGSSTLSQLAFNDNLSAVLPGLTAVGLPVDDVCGAGSTLSGTTSIGLQNGTLGPGASCSFDVTLEVPASAVGGGDFTNTTSPLTSAGLQLAEPATAVLEVIPESACTVGLDPTSTGPLPSAGGSGSFSVTSLAVCNWNAVASDPAVTVTAGSSGSGNGSVDFSVAGNPTGLTRNFSVDVTVTNNGATASHAISQDAAPCTIGVDPASSTVPGGGGSGSFAVDSLTGCGWTASVSDPDVTITGGASGSGDGTVTFDVATNPAGTPRSFSIVATVTGGGPSATHTIDQAALTCAPALTPPSATIPAAGGSGSFAVDVAETSCAWTATPSDPDVTVTGGASGTGDGTVTYDVAAAPGPARTLAIEVDVSATGESATHTIDQGQSACSFTLVPTSASFPEEGGSGSVDVDANRNGCAWTATSEDDWLSVTSGAAGTGDGTVDYQVEASNWAIPRTGTLTIAGQSFAVDQAAGTCTFAISPTAVAFGIFSGTQTVTVDTGVACAWEAVSEDDWISIESVDGGDGPGTATVGIDRNETGEDRTGTATVAGETLTVNQSGDDEGAFGLSPTAVGFPGAGGSGRVRVRAPSEVDWTAVPSAGWITIAGSAEGLGDGTIDYVVAPNPTDAVRTATIDVSGETFTVDQAPAGESTLQLLIIDVFPGAPGGPAEARDASRGPASSAHPFARRRR